MHFFFNYYFVNVISTYAVFGLWRYSSLRKRFDFFPIFSVVWPCPTDFRWPLDPMSDIDARSFAGPSSGRPWLTDFQSQTTEFVRRRVHTDRANAINYYDGWRVSIAFAAVASRANDANGRHPLWRYIPGAQHKRRGDLVFGFLSRGGGAFSAARANCRTMRPRYFPRTRHDYTLIFL